MACALGSLVALVALGAPVRAETGKTLEVTTGKTVARSWDEVKADKYAYAPKQDYDAAAKETHVYLPYGADGAYFEVSGLTMTDPGPDPGTGCPMARTTDGETSGKLVYKFHFDKPINSLRFYTGWAETGSGGDIVNGVEYSTDGQKWTTIAEVNKGGIVEPLCDGKKKCEVAKTQDLYVRLYSRDKNNPDSDHGPGRWMKFRMGGDPGWGDASSTFFRTQLQLWVTTAD
jgi:hypothetical protein